MPVCTIYLLSLSVPLLTFTAALKQLSPKPLVTAKVSRWIITPYRLSKEPLLHPSQPWDVLLILHSTNKHIPKNLLPMIKEEWSLQAGIPSKIVDSFETTNTRLLRPPVDEIPPLTGALSNPRIAESTQGLELNEELQSWISSGKGPKGPVSMLNLLSFLPEKKGEYLKYGKAFAQTIGSRRGGVAKIVGKVIPNSCSDGTGEWEEVCVHFFFSFGS